MEISQRSITVNQYTEFFNKLEIVHQQDEQELINLARDGLNEEIREGLETPEFPTLEALFEEASKVEEILEMEKTPTRKRSRKADKKGEPEDEDLTWWPQRDLASEEDQVSDDWGWYHGGTRINEDKGDMGDNILVSQQFMIVTFSASCDCQSKCLTCYLYVKLNDTSNFNEFPASSAVRLVGELLLPNSTRSLKSTRTNHL
ncbi:hypothetical protein Rs2_15989 [Raphanus sativus]|nr:hypothetical protein Rs2_15989 [Raphanus sativus]